MRYQIFLRIILAFLIVNIGLGNCASKLDRVDCIPERKVPTKDVCNSRSCVWDEDDTKDAPKCYFDLGYGYSGNGDIIAAAFGQSLNLTKTNANYTMFGRDIEEINFSVEFQTKTRLRFTFSDLKNKRYRVPIDLPKVIKRPSKTDYSVKISEKPFSFKIFRKGQSSPIWDTSLGPLIFSDQFLQISTRLPSKYLYGFGEQEHDSFLHELKWQRFGMFSRDQFPFNKGNLYGVHALYMCLEENGKAHGVFLLNSNAMDVQLQPTPGLTYRTIGGILDFYLFTGPTPENVVQQYTEFIGRPFMPPYWSLGFQLSRWGYNSLQRVKDVVDGMADNDLPQDVQYGDIDYMDRQLDFTYDKKTYNGLPEYVKSLKDRGMRYIIIVDPAISANETGYTTYDKGTKMDVWIKDRNNKTLFGKIHILYMLVKNIGVWFDDTLTMKKQVWPNYPAVSKKHVNWSLPWDKQTELYRAFTTFPDFFKSATSKWWIDEIKEFHKIIEFDGIWIDMNEPSNFVIGSLDGCENNTYNVPPYMPWLQKGENHLLGKTICMDSIQGLNGGTLHYNVHSLYGWSESIPTVRAAQEATGKRSIVISRSTFAGNGKNVGHWLGDNKSAWGQLHTSIIGMLEFNLFGIPYIGADICGFFDDTTPELCARWMQLGAFYPFSRNHNAANNKAQDPGSLGPEFSNLVRPTMVIRYTLLPYLYTLFYLSHTTGSTVVRPLMHEFIDDKTTWNIDKQFLWGPALLITPVLEKDNTSVRGYIPKERWFDFKTGIEHRPSPGWYEFEAPNNTTVLHVRGGYVLPMQGYANNTVYSRQKPMELLVALDDKEKANGKLFWDDGESNDTIAENEYILIDFDVQKGKLQTKPQQLSSTSPPPPYLDYITVYGVKLSNVTGVTTNGKDLSSFKFDSRTKVLRISEAKLDLTKTNTIQWKQKTNDATAVLRIFPFLVPFLVFFFSYY